MVRDEAGFLTSCLASLAGAVDAIYVTDTGSSDESVAVAESFGAIVRSFPWCNDFAAARNASIADVHEEWMLMVDADDVFPSGEAAKVRGQLAPEACAATLLYTADRNYTPTHALKLLRNRVGARFEGGIHENTERWLAECLAQGWKRQALDVHLVHTGYTPDAMPGKVARNLPMLEAEWRRMDMEPLTERRLHIGAELGLALAHAGRGGESALFLRGLLNEAASGGVAFPSALQVLVNLLWVLSEAGEALSGLEAARGVEPLLGHSPVYHLHRGLVELACKHFREARLWLSRFRDEAPEGNFTIPIPVEYTGVGLRRALGVSHLGERDYAGAMEYFGASAEPGPLNEDTNVRLLAG